MRKTILVAVAATAVAIGTAAPASADVTAGTSTTFTVTGGLLNISAPSAKDLGAGAPGASIAANLGSVAVDDARAALDANWTVSVSATNFVSSVTGAPAIANSRVAYAPGTATTTGVATVTPGLGGAMTAPQTAQQATLATGNNTATWNPTLTVSVPAAAVAGGYTGTVTHSFV